MKPAKRMYKKHIIVKLVNLRSAVEEHRLIVIKKCHNDARYKPRSLEKTPKESPHSLTRSLSIYMYSK